MKINTLIVDDEKLARDKIKRMLGKEKDIVIAGECVSGAAAVKSIREIKPDLIFLDIQMPGMNGFEVLEEIPGETMPAVIFMTAYCEYALKAFDFHALDYLLKPFDQERLHFSVEKARNQIDTLSSGELDRTLRTLISDIKTEKKSPERLLLKTAGRIYFVKTDDIDWIEAAGNYVKLHIGSKVHMLRETMKNIECKLTPEKFLRIHRSRFVNIDRIEELHPLFSGDYLVILRDKTELSLSRHYHDRLRELFDRFS